MWSWVKFSFKVWFAYLTAQIILTGAFLIVLCLGLIVADIIQHF